MPKIIPIPIGPIYNEGPCRGMVHVIEKGDTLYRLGKRYHVSVGQLMFANPFVNVYNLQVGDELCIPISIQPRIPESRMQGELMDDVRMPGTGTSGGMTPESRMSGQMGQGIAPETGMSGEPMPMPGANMAAPNAGMPVPDTEMEMPNASLPAQGNGTPMPNAGIPMELEPEPTEQE